VKSVSVEMLYLSSLTCQMYKTWNQASGCNLVTVDWSQITTVLHHNAKHRTSKNKHNAL